MTRCRSGFTIIELMVVVLIMGIMAGLAVLSVQGHIDRARWTQSIEQIEHLDRMGRIFARRDVSPYTLTFSRSKHKVELRATGANAPRKSLRECKLPKSFSFSSFQKNQERILGDKLEIEFSSSGQSSSYAVAIQASTGPSQWFVTLGLSGQQIRLENAKDVAALLSK
ncbi:MAG: type II secretion system protein [Pirellulaceae bacterium]|nr:type II secretion system protein [Pirellulaceae bacterium]